MFIKSQKINNINIPTYIILKSIWYFQVFVKILYLAAPLL